MYRICLVQEIPCTEYALHRWDINQSYPVLPGCGCDCCLLRQLGGDALLLLGGDALMLLGGDALMLLGGCALLRPALMQGGDAQGRSAADLLALRALLPLRTAAAVRFRGLSSFDPANDQQRG